MRFFAKSPRESQIAIVFFEIAKCVVRKRNGKSEKTEKWKLKTADKISYFGQRRHLCCTKKLQQTKSTRYCVSCAFLLLYSSLTNRQLHAVWSNAPCKTKARAWDSTVRIQYNACVAYGSLCNAKEVAGPFKDTEGRKEEIKKQTRQVTP